MQYNLKWPLEGVKIGVWNFLLNKFVKMKLTQPKKLKTLCFLGPSDLGNLALDFTNIEYKEISVNKSPKNQSFLRSQCSLALNGRLM